MDREFSLDFEAAGQDREWLHKPAGKDAVAWKHVANACTKNPGNESREQLIAGTMT